MSNSSVTSVLHRRSGVPLPCFRPSPPSSLNPLQQLSAMSRPLALALRNGARIRLPSRLTRLASLASSSSSSSSSSAAAFLHLPLVQRRTFISSLLGGKSKESDQDEYTPSQPPPPDPDAPTPRQILGQDDLFHPLSSSPFEDLRMRAERIKQMAPCPVCLEHFGERNLVAFDSPDAGWPTHCSEEHWKADDEHAKYADRLREANEDEHDLRSGRALVEFENLPGAFCCSALLLWSLHRCDQTLVPGCVRIRLTLDPLVSFSSFLHVGFQPYDSIVNFTNWDTFFFTRYVLRFMPLQVSRTDQRFTSFFPGPSPPWTTSGCSGT